MTSKEALPVAVTDIGNFKLPRLGRKKRIKHSKNPYKVKRILIPDDDQKPKKRLDGFLLLKVTKNDLPHEIIKADLSKLNIVETVVEDTKYFINLSDLDLSENEINLEDLVFFQSLVDLKLCSNKIELIKLTDEVRFEKLQHLDLSFNYLVPAAIESLQIIPNLKQLNLENNELRELPEDLTKFQNLEEINLSSNLFESDQNASNFWYSIAGIKKLKYLNLARNRLRGIHTEKLIAGNFSALEILDFSYNLVENQHNLICARNFKKLQKLIVTGNPFAILQEHMGLKMEIYARTGAELINKDIDRPYLKTDKNQNKLKIQYDNIRKVEDDNFGKDKNYFMGIEMPKDLNLQEEEQEQPIEDELGSEIQQRENELINLQLEQDSEGEQQQEENNVMFMTEDPDQYNKKNKRQSNNSSQRNFDQNQNYPQESLVGNSNNIQHITQNQTANMSYEQQMQAFSQHLGDEKEYEHNYDLNTAYKTLKGVNKKPEDFNYKNHEEPNYLKSTKTIKRYKSKQNGSSIIKAESFERMDNSKLNGSKSRSINNSNQLLNDENTNNKYN